MTDKEKDPEDEAKQRAANPDYDIVYVDDHSRCWQHMGKGEYDEIDITTLQLKPVLVQIPGQYYIGGSRVGIHAPCTIKDRIILPKPSASAKWL